MLHDQEAQHCQKVLRHKVGDIINVIDGQGHLYKADIIAITKRSVEAAITDKQYFDSPTNRPSIAFGLIKNTTRLEWLIEKITEIGVTTIQPLICQRSEKRHIKEERLLKVILSASKQSKQYHFPVLKPLMKFKDFISQPLEQQGYVAHYVPGQKDIWDMHQTSSASVFLIGPEGDFTNEEHEAAQAAGYQSVNLGQSRLRAETAAMVACTHLNR